MGTSRSWKVTRAEKDHKHWVHAFKVIDIFGCVDNQPSSTETLAPHYRKLTGEPPENCSSVNDPRQVHSYISRWNKMAKELKVGGHAPFKDGCIIEEGVHHRVCQKRDLIRGGKGRLYWIDNQILKRRPDTAVTTTAHVLEPTPSLNLLTSAEILPTSDMPPFTSDTIVQTSEESPFVEHNLKKRKRASTAITSTSTSTTTSTSTDASVQTDTEQQRPTYKRKAYETLDGLIDVIEIAKRRHVQPGTHEDAIFRQQVAWGVNLMVYYCFNNVE